jgi:hypothetical protein
MTLKYACTAQSLAIILLLLATPTTAQDKNVGAIVEGQVVKLLEQGIAPLQTLRIAPAMGMKQSAIMRMKVDQTMVMRGQKLPPTPTPATQFTIEVDITDIAANGDVSVEYRCPKVEVIDESNEPSPVKPMMETLLKSMKGLTGTATVSNRGFTKKSNVTLPPNAEPNIQAARDIMKAWMNLMSSPLPEEPVGVGAKWKVIQLIESNGMNVKQTTVHTLKEIKGKAIEIAIEQAQTADAQELKTPGVPTGTTTKLLSLDSTGAGKMQFVSSDLFPFSSMKSDSKIGMEMIAAGNTIPMQVEMSVEVTVTPAK